MRTGALLIVCLLGTSAFASQAQSHQRTPERNVFLITIDTLRADHVHCYGYQNVRTPALDMLARDGIRFAQAFTPSPITNSSHTTILTGLLPSSHGVTDFAVPLRPAQVTWAELLKAHGYHTAAFIGAVILDSHSLASGLDRGFDFYDNFPQNLPNSVHWGRVERRGMEVVSRSRKWLTNHPAEPQFVWVHLYDPHDPYEPPAPYSRIYKDHLYDGEIAYADSALANFLDFLKLRGRYDKALIIVVGDHGEGLGEHGEDTHGIFLYDSTTHVPLIIKLPGEENAGKVVQTQVRTTDILPTVLDLLRIPIPSRLDGESLEPMFAKASTDRIAFGETDYPLRFGWAPLRSVRAGTFKFIEAPRPELYDLHADPGEVHNSYVPWDRDVQQSRSLLAALNAKLSTQPSSSAAVPQNTVDELRALGYLGKADVGSSTNVPEPSLLPDPKDKIQEVNLLHVAMMASEDNHTSEARIALQKVLKMDPNSATALREIGELELNAGDYANAAEHLHAAVESRPSDSTALFYEGEAREKLGEHAEARDDLEKSLKLVPEQLPGRVLLGQIYLELNNPKAAEDQFEAANLLDSRNLDAQLGLAQSAMAEGNTSDAIAQLKTLAATHPKSAQIFHLLARAYANIGKEAEANRAEARAAALLQKNGTDASQ